MLDRLLDSTYSAFDKNPNAQIVLRITHPAGVAWKVADRTLTLATEAGAPLAAIALRGIKLAELAGLIAGAGCTVVYLNIDMAQRGADCLLPGSARQSDSNGDVLRAYDSMLWSVLDAFAVVLEDANADVVTALQQLYMGTATGEILDVWGGYFGLLRLTGELDDAYRARIITETLRPRVNKYAIENAIQASTGHTVELYEPWRNTFVLGQSALDGDDHMEDGTYWTHNVIQPTTTDKVADWSAILAIVERSRAAGVIVAPPQYQGRMSANANLSTNTTVKGGMESVRSMAARLARKGQLDSFALGNEVADDTNWKCSMAELISLQNEVGLREQGSINASKRTLRRANIILSDSDAIGEINSVFQRTYWIQGPDDMVLGGAALSAYDGAIALGMVDEILTLFAASLSFSDFGGAQVSAGIEEVRSFGAIPAYEKISTQQPQVAIEAIHAEQVDVAKVMTPAVRMWGFGGVGSWNQNAGQTWNNDGEWGAGVPQS